MSVTVDRKEHLGVLKAYDTGWAKEVNIVSWNGAPEGIDIRDWDADHERMSRGVNLKMDEAKELYKVLAEYFKED